MKSALMMMTVVVSAVASQMIIFLVRMLAGAFLRGVSEWVYSANAWFLPTVQKTCRFG